MAQWVKCTRKADDMPIYVNISIALWLRRNEEQNFTLVCWAGAKENIVRVLETPEEILKQIDS
jgi:hypothetical protein